ncbi:class-II fumarase/aspartase family protein [Amycolatopsis pithecellobii]|uniref:Adenylosuccinate lyase family protein n=1 Tax=Amycolatopsis pithecellobii TaxID=664692 RepID=A0A6N7Z007_9PSEU|nr:adenylosuccinate lyase family protein [Amycolatopsis pithecellobii]MTD57562.1 adenylosuccinate lyase family protein [Amycolatopsis pithecellobii]
MRTSTRFTDGRVPEPGISPLFERENRWQRWLDVEAALALTEAELGVIPGESATVIARAAQLSNFDLARVQHDMAVTSHPLMPLITQLSEVAGEPHGGWVHWGVTTQNVTQTGDVLLVRQAHSLLRTWLGRALRAAAGLAERGAEVVMAGRTHGQHAVPITFGFKVATWIDDLIRHVDRFAQAEDRLFVALVGGAVGNFASFGSLGPRIQQGVADRLDLRPADVPARTMADPFAEYVCLLAMLAATGGRIGREISTLMKTELGEVREPAPRETIGSSTMPHKVNPQLCQDITALSAQIRTLVPLALEAVLHEHEADGACQSMMDNAMTQAIMLTGDLLTRLVLVLSGLELDETRMRTNLDLTGGLITSEAVMLSLGTSVGRQNSHEIVHNAASAARNGTSFADALAKDPRVSENLSSSDLADLADPSSYIGLSTAISLESADRARKAADAIDSAALPHP